MSKRAGAIDNRAGDVTAKLAHPLRHVADFFQGFTQFGAGDQNHFGLEVAGDFGVQARSKWMAGVGMQTFGYQHIKSAIGCAQAQADDLFQ